MTDYLSSSKEVTSSPPLSKRAARRVIQRAFVLVGRDRTVRQNLRSVELNTRWAVFDWNLEWTVLIDRGHLEFHRGHVGKAQVGLSWKTGEGFLAHIETGSPLKDVFEMDCDPASRRVVDLLFNAFRGPLKKVLDDPVDDDGVRLM